VFEVDEPIRVVPYDPAWQDLGRELVGQVADVLSATPVDVTHIGSTAVPGLAAKPVIDVQVGCTPSDTARVVARLGQLGFEHLGQTGGPGREYLRRRTGRLANIAVVERRGQLWADNIMFRDYLRARPAVAARYAWIKLQAAEEAGMLTAYSALKATTVVEIMRDARREYVLGAEGFAADSQCPPDIRGVDAVVGHESDPVRAGCSAQQPLVGACGQEAGCGHGLQPEVHDVRLDPAKVAVDPGHLGQALGQ
jgi:GrpB-like predicted nucleotidyltransferase (UPF0157 family)